MKSSPIKDFESEVIFKKLVHQCNFEDPSHPTTFITFISFENSKERFSAFGAVPDYFKVGDEVDLKCVRKYCNGKYENRIIDIFHKNLQTHYYPLVEFFPSAKTLRNEYQMINWTYQAPDVNLFWVICDGEVYLYSRKNGGPSGDMLRLFKPNRILQHIKYTRCEFYLNRLKN
jgi:hypothetical protein